MPVRAAQPAGAHPDPGLAGPRLGDGPRLQAHVACSVGNGGAHGRMAGGRHGRGGYHGRGRRSVAIQAFHHGPHTRGQAIVASAKTSACRPPSDSGTNLPHDTPSV